MKLLSSTTLISLQATSGSNLFDNSVSQLVSCTLIYHYSLSSVEKLGVKPEVEVYTNTPGTVGEDWYTVHQYLKLLW